jgi:hypothetical protein
MIEFPSALLASLKRVGHIMDFHLIGGLDLEPLESLTSVGRFRTLDKYLAFDHSGAANRHRLIALDAERNHHARLDVAGFDHPENWRVCIPTATHAAKSTTEGNLQ